MFNLPSKNSPKDKILAQIFDSTLPPPCDIWWHGPSLHPLRVPRIIWMALTTQEGRISVTFWYQQQQRTKKRKKLYTYGVSFESFKAKVIFPLSRTHTHALSLTHTHTHSLSYTHARNTLSHTLLCWVNLEVVWTSVICVGLNCKTTTIKGWKWRNFRIFKRK